MSAQDTSHADDTTITSNDDADQAVVDQIDAADSVTGEDNEFTTWQAPSSDTAYNGWPDIPRRLPRSSAHGILHDTSLDDRNELRDRPAPTGPTRAQTEAQQAAVQAEIEADQRAEREERAAAEEARYRQASDNADRAADDLRAHQRSQLALIDVYESSLTRWSQENPTAYAAFQAHREYARVITQEDVRLYDILCWFQQAPQFIRLPHNDLARSYREESRLRMTLNRHERGSASVPARLSTTQQEAAAGAEVGAPGYGLERDPEIHSITVGTFAIPDFDTQEQEAAWVRAAFEIRMVRLEHEQDPALRWPQCYPFQRSLDSSMREWCLAVDHHYIDENDQYRQAFNDDLAETIMDVRAYEQDQGWP